MLYTKQCLSPHNTTNTLYAPEPAKGTGPLVSLLYQLFPSSCLAYLLQFPSLLRQPGMSPCQFDLDCKLSGAMIADGHIGIPA